jgi:hypothetical protein
MKTYHRLILPIMLMAGVMQASVADFSRYEVILSRRPFGEPPPVSNTGATEKPVQTGPSFADSLKLVALTYNRGDVRVGFVDTRQKPQKTYFLFVGDRQDGIEVVSASYEDERVVLRKDGDERTLSMASGGGVVESQRPATPADRYGVSGNRATMASSYSSSGKRTPRILSAARQARLDERRRRAEQMPELHGKVLEKHLQEYNMQAIRSGAPALPIPLTPEQDAQLVEEGILAPQE